MSYDARKFVVELKYDKTAKAAIQQMKEKHYTQAFESYTGEIILVGILFVSGFLLS